MDRRDSDSDNQRIDKTADTGDGPFLMPVVECPYPLSLFSTQFLLATNGRKYYLGQVLMR